MTRSARDVGRRADAAIHGALRSPETADLQELRGPCGRAVADHQLLEADQTSLQRLLQIMADGLECDTAVARAREA